MSNVNNFGKPLVKLDTNVYSIIFILNVITQNIVEAKTLECVIWSNLVEKTLIEMSNGWKLPGSTNKIEYEQYEISLPLTFDSRVL